MKVKDLKEKIKYLPDDMDIIVQKDAEGNGYSPLAGADANCVYVPDTTWQGEVYATDWNADDALLTEEEWKEVLEKPRALVLFPVS